MTNPKVSDERVQQYATEELCEAHRIGVRCGVCDGILMARELLTLRSENERLKHPVSDEGLERSFHVWNSGANATQWDELEPFERERWKCAISAARITPPAPGPTSTEEKADGNSE